TLPDGVIPISHALESTLDPSQPVFSGVARIEVELKRAVSEIWVNGHDVKVSEGSVAYNGTTLPAAIQLSVNEFIGLAVKAPIGPGKATLEPHYTAPLSDTAKSGPYRRQTDGEWYAFTVFTPIDARRAFPCFDEPRFKTPWSVSIRVRPTDKAFANA